MCLEIAGAPPVSAEPLSLSAAVKGKQAKHFLCKPIALHAWFYVISDWAWIACAAFFSLAFPQWEAYFLAVVIIGSRQHALAVLLHDASHFMLFGRRWLNDGVARVLLEWPLFASLDSYRLLHRKHHRYLNTHADPDWDRNKPYRLSEKNSLQQKICYLAGLGVVASAIKALFLGMPMERSKNNTDKFPSGVMSSQLYSRWMMYASGLWLLYTHGWLHHFVHYWLVPYFFYFFPVMRFRGLSEHWAVASESMSNKARTVIVGPMARFFVYPHNINYHIEHHCYPNVPFYHLPKLHRWLLSDVQFKKCAHVTSGVSGVVKELLSAPR